MSKANRSERFRRQLDGAVGRVAPAVRKFAMALSGHAGHDCALHAGLGQALLEEMGIKTHQVLAMRVGSSVREQPTVCRTSPTTI